MNKYVGITNNIFRQLLVTFIEFKESINVTVPV